MTINNNGIVIWNEISSDLSFVEFVISVSDGLLSDYENVTLNIIQFYDCNGDANGTAVEDCNGEWGGTAIDDECGMGIAQV